KILAQCLILHGVPADSHPQAQTPTTQDVNLCSLLRQQRRLSLPQNNHLGHQFKALRDGGEIAVEYKRLMKHVALGIGTLPARMMRHISPEHVVKDSQMFIAHTLSGLHEVAHGCGVSTNLGLRKDYAQLHGLAPLVNTLVQHKVRS